MIDRTTPLRAFFLILSFPLMLSAQRSEDLNFSRPEAWAMKYFGAVSLMQGSGPPVGLEKGQWALGFEMSNIPSLSKSERTVGFNGTKEEDLNKSPLLARPLLHYGITDRLSLTASYVPPLEVFDGLRTELAGLTINYLHPLNDRFQLGVRVIGQWSEAKGDFTAPNKVVGNPDLDINPFEAIRQSRDTYTSYTSTLETTLYYRLDTERESYLFFNASYTYGDFDFDVLVPQPDDNFHTNYLYTDGYIWAFGGGIEFAVSDKTSLRLSTVYAPLDVRRPPEYNRSNDDLLNIRLVLNYLFP